ncbi:hypothetical protein MSAN_01964300 [Mycena sanguinolenta]|uniref:Uncharacterized protein n=1 Tax=Mycena sanguinolenta TaxID=230812 RepID=A0A8H6XNS9_9AGAR|nr:hypothetical protein MSAN_01964300 [Mycena sanguinolenta]
MPRRRIIACFTVILFILIAPDLLRRSLYTAPLADTVEWLRDRLMKGYTAAAFFLAVFDACSLAYDAYQWLTSRSAEPTPAPAPSPTPAELEEGAATRAYRLALYEAEIAGTLPPPPPTPTSTLYPSAVAQATPGRKILLLLGSTAFLVLGLSADKVVLREKPLLENISAVAVYFLRGWEGVLVVVLVAMGMAWRQREVQEAEDTLPDEDLETPFEKEFSEKA